MIRLINTSAHETGLPAQSVHAIITSPPYWGLRQYDGDQTVDWPPVTFRPNPLYDYEVTIPAMGCDLGLEPTPAAYIGHMVLVLRELGRVLRDDGTLWVNLGDSYASNPASNPASGGKQSDRLTGGQHQRTPQTRKYERPDGLPAKNLVGIPWQFAQAAQAEGWILRSDVIWAKSNPMPESVRDRPTKAHEYIFLLAKSDRYFYDAEAVREPNADPDRVNSSPSKGRLDSADFKKSSGDNHRGFKKTKNNTGRNRRTVWTVATRPYSAAHFAVYPPDLIEPCILASTSARGVCPHCGAQWERKIERTGADMESRYKRGGPKRHGLNGAAASSASGVGRYSGEQITTGWAPGCECPDHEPIPATVLDPFHGSGTTGHVAIKHRRQYIGVDISEHYLSEHDRITGTQIALF